MSDSSKDTATASLRWPRLDEIVGNAREAITQHPQLATRAYVATLLFCALLVLVLTPIGSGDTDLWYHLNGGRLLWEFGDLPDTAFFSFVEDQTPWVNYFWGFQATSFLVHDVGGYEGLILLRVVLVGVTATAITALVLRGNDSPRQRAWALILLALTLTVVFGRISLIRPHLVSYMMIAVFLLILERHPRWLPALPILTVFWVNLHGVEWLVGGAICGAYFLERLWQWRRDGRVADPRVRSTLLWTTACLPALFVNPFGIGVLGAPFNTPADVYAYIQELRSVSLTKLMTMSLVGAKLGVSSAISLLFYATLAAYGYLLLRRQIRLAPLLLSAAGLVLLTRGNRFIWEWILLSLPLWRCIIDTIPPTPDTADRRIPKLTDLVLILVLASPFVSWFQGIIVQHKWPLDPEKLPIGVTEFIRSHGLQGRLMAAPNSGGYLAWRLYPEVLITTDMQTPPSTPWTHFRISNALGNPHALRRFLDEFDPQLIGVLYNRTGIGELLQKAPAYRPVFFDDLLVLYASNRHLPELVAEHELHHVNPHNLLDDGRGTLEQRLRETRRILDEFPNSRRALHSITRLLIDQGEYERALAFAERYRKTHPEDPNSHFLAGNAHEYLNRCEQAIPLFEDAFDEATEDFKPTLHRHMGSCYYVLKDFPASFRHFEEAINTYSDPVEPQHRFQFALAAVAMGKEDKARTLLKHLLYTVDPSDTASIDKARALLADL